MRGEGWSEISKVVGSKITTYVLNNILQNRKSTLMQEAPRQCGNQGKWEIQTLLPCPTSGNRVGGGNLLTLLSQMCEIQSIEYHAMDYNFRHKLLGRFDHEQYFSKILFILSKYAVIT